jgi:hypothetical protein
LRFLTGQAEQARMKIEHVFGQKFNRVAFRIDSDEQRLNRHHILAQGIQRNRDILQLGRADMGTITIPEKDQHQPATEIAIAYRLAGMVG